MKTRMHLLISSENILERVLEQCSKSFKNGSFSTISRTISVYEVKKWELFLLTDFLSLLDNKSGMNRSIFR